MDVAVAEFFAELHIVSSRRFLRVLTKPAGNCWLTSIAPKEGKEEIQEVTVSLASAKQISMDATVMAVLAELDGTFQSGS